MRLIDAHSMNINDLPAYCLNYYVDIQNWIDNQKTVKRAHVAHAKWEHRRRFELNTVERRYYECSNCKAWESYTTRYCPDCGAKMDLE